MDLAFSKGRGLLWVKLIKSIHGDLVTRVEEGRVNAKYNGVLCNITKICNDLSSVGIDFKNSFKRKVGNGGETSFWLEKWVGDFALRDKFPRLFNIDNNKMGLISEIGIWREDKWEWDWNWKREPRGRT